MFFQLNNMNKLRNYKKIFLIDSSIINIYKNIIKIYLFIYKNNANYKIFL